MTEEGKSPKTNNGDFPSSLENANCAFPTFPPPRLLLSSTQKHHQKPKPKGAFLDHLFAPLQAHLSIGKDFLRHRGVVSTSNVRLN